MHLDDNPTGDYTSLLTFAFSRFIFSLWRLRDLIPPRAALREQPRPAHSAIVASDEEAVRKGKGPDFTGWKMLSPEEKHWGWNGSSVGWGGRGDQRAEDVQWFWPGRFWDQSTQKGDGDLSLLWTLELLTFSSSLTFCQAQSWLCVLFFTVNVLSFRFWFGFFITLYTQKVKLKYFLSGG